MQPSPSGARPELTTAIPTHPCHAAFLPCRISSASPPAEPLCTGNAQVEYRPIACSCARRSRRLQPTRLVTCRARCARGSSAHSPNQCRPPAMQTLCRAASCALLSHCRLAAAGHCSRSCSQWQAADPRRRARMLREWVPGPNPNPNPNLTLMPAQQVPTHAPGVGTWP